MPALIQLLIGVFSGGIGQKVGQVATNVGVLAALAPLALWLVKNKEDTFIVLTYGDLAFWGVILAVVLKMAHYTRAGSA